MTNTSTKRALLSSAIALCLCFVMLLGTTFAWFTDEVSSSNNVIKTGTLDVELYKWTGTDTKVGISELAKDGENTNIFGHMYSETAGSKSEDTLWEPGKTQTVYLSIKNNGSLALKYTVVIEVTDIVNDLNEVLTYVISPDAKYGDFDERTDIIWDNEAKVEAGINFTSSRDVTLLPEDEHFFALSVHMDELAGNKYQESNINFNIKVLAGQLASEDDSFDNQYDANAEYGFYAIPAKTNPETGAYEFAYNDPTTGEKIGTINVPADALPDNAVGIYYVVTPKDSVDADFTVSANNYTTAYAFDVTVAGLKENNDVRILTELRIDTGLDFNSITVYHNNERIPVDTYNPKTGLVRFYTTSFSPFTVLVGEIIEDDDNTGSGDSGESGEQVKPLPKAEVTYAPDHVNNPDIEWTIYDEWTTTEGLETNLEAAFLFKSPHDGTTVNDSGYANWYCDFVVSLDRALAADQIFLGGTYGDYGWIGFHNGDQTFEKDHEIYLLGSVTKNPWTYADVASWVNEFTCGVGDVDNALDGATFTVRLRLTNPENEAEFYDVNVVTYTFGGNAVIDGVVVDTTANN